MKTTGYKFIDTPAAAGGNIADFFIKLIELSPVIILTVIVVLLITKYFDRWERKNMIYKTNKFIGTPGRRNG